LSTKKEKESDGTKKKKGKKEKGKKSSEGDIEAKPKDGTTVKKKRRRKEAKRAKKLDEKDMIKLLENPASAKEVEPEKKYKAQTRWQDFTIVGTSTAVITLIAHLYNPENTAMFGASPHPFFMMSCIFSAYYGFSFSVMASLFYSLLYLLLLHIQVDYEEVETLMSITYLGLPIGTMVTSLILGEMRQKIMNRVVDLREANEEKDHMVEHLNNRNAYLINESLELKERLISRLETAGMFYSIADRLSELDIDKLLKNFLNIISEQLGVEKAAIYLKHEGDHQLQLQNSLNKTTLKKIPKLVDPRKNRQKIVKEAIGEKKIATLQNVASKEDLENIKTDFVIVVPIYLESNLFCIIGIMQIPFLKYIPSSFSLLETLAKWLTTALSHLFQYQKLSGTVVIDEIFNLYKFNYFKDRLQEEFHHAKFMMLPLTLVGVHFTNHDEIEIERRTAIKKLVSEVCRKKTRKMDCVALGDFEEVWYFILPLSDLTRAHQVIDEIQEELKHYDILINENGDKLGLIFKPNSFHEQMSTSEDLWMSVQLDEDEVSPGDSMPTEMVAGDHYNPHQTTATTATTAVTAPESTIAPHQIQTESKESSEVWPPRVSS
jgi:hypothetical protein